MSHLENSDILTSDEEIFSNHSKDLTIEDSSDSNDEVIARRRPLRGTFRRPAAILSDSDSEDEQLERRALSPRTRMSITGIRPSDLSDDSSEVGYSSSEKAEKKENSFIRNEAIPENSESSVVISDDESDSETSDHARQKLGRSPKTCNESVLQNKMNSKDDASNQNETLPQNSESSVLESDDETESDMSDHVSQKLNRFPETCDGSVLENNINVKDDTSNKQINPIISPLKYPNPSAIRYSAVFEHSIKDKFSSTINQANDTINESDKSSNDSDVIVLAKKEDIVDISSDDNDSAKNTGLMHSAPVKKDFKKTTQPKITTALSQVPSTSRNAAEIKFVSQEFYDKEIMKLDDLKADLVSAEGLFEKLGPSLYDGGKQLSLRIDSLKSSIKKKAEEIVNLMVEVKIADSKPGAVIEKKGKNFFNQDASNWDDLSAAVNQINPIFTGKQGLNTFNKQKVLTIERLKDLHGSLETCPGDEVLADDPNGLKVTLMAHQKHALAWMYWREHQKPRGGILADDMGLGKTLTMISMVLAFKNKEDSTEDTDDSNDEEEKENRGWSSKNRRDYYNGGTLVVCPASLMRQWENEVENKVARHKISVCVHHGNNRDTKPRHLATYDIVITTYNIVSREAKSHGALFSIKWKRIILDEAHVVRNHKSQSSVAVCELRGKCRWALTGTPIQNKEMDVYALLKFIKCTPFDDLSHWKKWIDNKSAGGQQRLNTLMKSLMLRRTKSQLQQQGSLMCLPERESKLIEVHLDKDEMNVYQKIMTYSKTLFAQFLYQRAEKNNDIYFNDQGYRPTFMQSKDPNGAYHKMHQKFSKMHHGGKEIKSHEILVLLLRLRQICCHPGLIDAMLEDENASANSDTDSIEPEIDLLDQLNKLAIKDNSESTSLLTDSLNDDGHHEAISKASAKVLQRSNPVFDLSRPSSKMNKVLQIVEEQILNSSDKGIIISQWTSILNILKNHLEAKGVRTLSLNGTIQVKNRQSIVTEFNDPNTKPKILLLSLTAGGVGLNLVGANHLLLIDLHWNPQLEAQAQDRIYRVGQEKPVHIYKFMCKDTVEERIKALQDQKLEIANGLLTGVKASEGSKLSIDDLKGLFGL